MNILENMWNGIRQGFTIVNFPMDILDIIIVAFLIYKVLSLTRTKSTRQIVTVVIALLVLSYVSSALGLNALNYVISRVIEVGLIALVVVFQPELRRIMEQLGALSLRGLLLPKSQVGDSMQTVEQTVAACRTMSRQKVGALIVFQRETELDQYIESGTVINADVSEELLKNIFFPKAALHDGAVLIHKDRIVAAGCVLPLTDNPNLSRDLGTRHRAAIGMSEKSDAVVVVVSEETGVISCVIGGNLRRYLTPETLTKLLVEELVEEEPVQPVPVRLLDRLKQLLGGKEDGHESK